MAAASDFRVSELPAENSFRPVWYLYIFAALAASKMLSYWIIGWMAGEDSSVVALYRYGDIQNYPFLRFFGDLRLSESTVWDEHPPYWLSFPFVPMAVHAFSFKLAGIVGLAFADALFGLLDFIAINLLFRSAQVSAPLRHVAALGLCLLASKARLPRPFVTEPLAVLCLAGMIKLMVIGERRSGWSWAGFGVVFGIAVQSNIFMGGILGLLALAGAARLWLSTKQANRELLKNLCIFGLAGTITLLPLMLARIFENPDLPRRLGIYSTSRVQPLFATEYVVPMLLATGGLGALFLIFRRWAPDSTLKRRVLLAIPLGWLLSFLALPLSCIVAGKTVQPYHFDYEMRTLFRYGLAIAGLYLIEFVGAKVSQSSLRVAPLVRRWAAVRSLQIVALLLLSTGTVLFLVRRHSVAHARTIHMRSDMQEYATLPSYRQHFAALVQELRRPQYASCQVLGTFDHQVWAWWLTFHDRKVFLPDTFDTTLSDHALENRLIGLCATVRMPPDEFRRFIQRVYVNVFWLGCGKYQAHSGYTFAPLSDYSPEDQEAIKKTGKLNSWALALPLSTQARLEERFCEHLDRPGELPRLDLIVLTNDDSLRDFQPAPELFPLVYQNPVFRVFQASGQRPAQNQRQRRQRLL